MRIDGAKLRRRRAAAPGKVTLQRLADQLGIDKVNLWRAEQGAFNMPPARARKIARILGCDVADLELGADRPGPLRFKFGGGSIEIVPRGAGVIGRRRKAREVVMRIEMSGVIES